jgi:hypothetical protein
MDKLKYMWHYGCLSNLKESLTIFIFICAGLAITVLGGLGIIVVMSWLTVGEAFAFTILWLLLFIIVINTDWTHYEKCP